MHDQIRSIRPFIGTSDFKLSRAFYTDFGFEEVRLSTDMCYFRLGSYGFYLQDYYVKDWIKNSMLFLEVSDVVAYHKTIASLKLPHKYENVRVSDIQTNDWGSEFFVHDPMTILWHIGTFKS
jgi:catechol 2,3-dioxygenase-like lactoylglutathione lyase family enzyme